MPHWLARECRGQDSDWIQRFDPRFWTVDFPRPTMASVLAHGPDHLRVDCEFQRQGDLAGLIWASEDTYDHPLLAYRTDRDYAHTVLRFRWRSNGLVPLDQVDGPTLTIEGRDAAGQPRTWYVRLWNYAIGSPTDAAIELAFSDLHGGWTADGERVHPGDIDRMFVSLVPPGHLAGSTTPFAAPTVASVDLSEIVCEGSRAMLAIGDAILPPHGERMATAYDDCYNQTPTRLLRSIRALGYRDTILHYVGMSHFPRLRAEGEALPVQRPAALCGPAQVWHRAFFGRCRECGFETIVSLSYELLAEHCPVEWQQCGPDGSPARTGWVPPSALLSPANSEAMQWLRDVALQFTAMLEDEGLPVRFQVGEPWWWVDPETKAPCLYDAAAVVAFGGDPPAIADVRTPLDAAQVALLDAAGALLAQSTAELAQAVRDAATGEAEILLLAFTPTVLDPAMPELRRANLPLGWAWPAFDRLQLEDYDWLTAGMAGRCRTARAEVAARLGYPLDRQDYLAGFVLDPGDAETMWPRIDAALDEAAAHGIARRYVWALPQVARDGFTRLPPSTEDDMQAFDDVLYPLALGRDAGVSPEFSTSVAVTASGHERRNSLWADARLRFDVGPGIRSESELGTLIAFFRARRGAARGFRLSDPFDCSSNGMTGSPTPLDQLLGTGDGARDSFALVKAYGPPPDPQVRRITRPRGETLRVSVGGVEAFGWTLAPGGMVTLAETPPEGAEVRAGFLFDVPVRFEQDRLDVTGAAFAAGEAPSVPLIEVREAA